MFFFIWRRSTLVYRSPFERFEEQRHYAVCQRHTKAQSKYPHYYPSVESCGRGRHR